MPFLSLVSAELLHQHSLSNSWTFETHLFARLFIGDIDAIRGDKSLDTSGFGWKLSRRELNLRTIGISPAVNDRSFGRRHANGECAEDGAGSHNLHGDDCRSKLRRTSCRRRIEYRREQNAKGSKKVENRMTRAHNSNVGSCNPDRK